MLLFFENEVFFEFMKASEIKIILLEFEEFSDSRYSVVAYPQAGFGEFFLQPVYEVVGDDAKGGIEDDVRLVFLDLSCHYLEIPRGFPILYFVFLGPVLLGSFVVYPVLLVFNSVFVEVLDEGVSINACLLVYFVPFMPRCFCRKVNKSVVNERW